MLIAILASHAPSPGSQKYRDTLRGRGAWKLGGGCAENLKKIFFSCHGERVDYHRFRPKGCECGWWKGKGAKVQLPGEVPLVLIG